MKRQKGSMLIENMGLVPGEKFLIGEDGEEAVLAMYVGPVLDKESGDTYDDIRFIDVD